MTDNDRYALIQLTVGARAEGGYLVRVTAGDRELEHDLDLPDELADLGAQLLKPNTIVPLDTPEAIGLKLGRALFSPEIRDLVLRYTRTAAAAGRRVQIRLQIADHELATLPWEWVALGGARSWVPALRDDYALIRVGRGVSPPQPLPLDGPLRILAVGAPGELAQLDALEAALAETLQRGSIDLRLLSDATAEALASALDEIDPAIVHLAAPVLLTSEEELEVRLNRPIDAFALADMLRSREHLRLVTVCGSRGDGQLLSATPGLLAALLLGERQPATLAVGGALTASALAGAAASCYTLLAAGAPIDLATTAGRRWLADNGGAPVWGHLQVRALPDTGQLFRPRRAAATTPERLQRWVLPVVIAVVLVLLLLGGRLLSGRAAPSTPVPPPTVMVFTPQPIPTLAPAETKTP